MGYTYLNLKFMKVRLVGIIAIIFNLYACDKPVISNPNIEDEERLIFNFDKISTNSYPYEIVKIIPLETTQNNFLSDNLTIKFTSDFIFVFDEQIRDAIHKFNHDGRYLSQIINVGEGPENLSSIEDFIVSEKKIEILCGKGAYSEIVYYSIDEGKITNKLKLDFTGYSFEKIGDSYFIYSSYNYPFADFRVSKVDLQGNVLGNYLKNDYSGTMLPVVERNFFTSNGKTFLIESFNNSIYELTKNNVKIKYSFDFGDRNIPKDFFEGDMMITFQKLNENGFFSIANHFESSKIAFTRLVFQKENSGESYHILFNKESQEIVKNKVQDPWRDLFKYPVGITDANLIIFSASPQILSRNADLLNQNASLAIELIGVESHDNPVLIYSKLSAAN